MKENDIVMVQIPFAVCKKGDYVKIITVLGNSCHVQLLDGPNIIIMNVNKEYLQ